MALSIKRIVNVSMSLSPLAAQSRGFGTLCILGDSDVITAAEGFRSYTGYDAVAEDFGPDAHETLAAQAYFSQSPQPTSLIISRWFNAPISAALYGGTPAQMSELKVESGGFKITIDSEEVEVSGLDTREAETVENVAALITSKLTTKGRCTVQSGKFVIFSAKSGTASQITVASAPSSGTDMSALLGLTAEKGATIVEGKDETETLDSRLSTLLTDFGRDFYGLILATTQTLSDDDHLRVAQAIEASDESHIYGITVTDADMLDEAYTPESDDLPSKLMRGQYARTICFYAENHEGETAYRLNPYFAASALGRMFTVNFNGSMTTITLKFKQAPSIQPTNLRESQAKNLADRNCNFYAIYENDTYIIESGIMASGMHADERHGLDWLQDAIQTAVFNALYQSRTKIPQTDDGVAMIQAKIEQALQQGVTNGLIAPGVWNSDGFGALSAGDTLKSGFYVYAGSVNDQPQADREARKAPAIQVAIKLAGAIESADVTVNVNR